MDSLSCAFLIYSGVLVFAIVVGIVRYLSKYKIKSIVGFVFWLVYGGALSYSGVLADASRKPPAIIFLLVPMIAWILIAARTRLGQVVADAVPVHILIGAQVFRVGVEIFLEMLWQAGLLPEMMTYHGANLDILVGLSAPVVAVLLVRKMISAKVVMIWNFVGIFILANVVIRGILTTPGPLRLLESDVPNTALTVFPFTYIAVLMVALAFSLHIFAVRNLLRPGQS